MDNRVANRINSRELVVDGLSLHCRDSGGDGTIVFLLHGNSTSSDIFDGVLNSVDLSQFRFVALDWPGHGASPPSSSPEQHYSIPGLARLMRKVLAHFAGLPYALVGHSLGGHVIAHMLCEQDDACAAVLISAPPISVTTIANAFKPAPTKGGLFSEQLDATTARAFAGALPGPTSQRTVRLQRFTQIILSTDPAFRPGLGASLAAGQLQDEAFVIGNGKVAVALIWGTSDLFLGPEFIARAIIGNPLLSGLFPFPEAGHSPHLDQPAKFVHLLGNFLKMLSLLQLEMSSTRGDRSLRGNLHTGGDARPTFALPVAIIDKNVRYFS